ncbi:MAG: hypothetical protein ACM31C_33055, partial [Acidobacteriota bacterium]
TFHVPYSGADLDFGNVCLGAGGGKTLGFWTNKNGETLFKGTDSGAASLAMLVGLNLVNAGGIPFDPTTYAQVKTWFNNATATNMAYMLSAQLAAMELSVQKGVVDGAALVYAPGVTGASALGFISVTALMAEANTQLGLDGNTPSGDPNRAYQETVKNALDHANNNLTFLQATACAIDFGTAGIIQQSVNSVPGMLLTRQSQ